MGLRKLGVGIALLAATACGGEGGSREAQADFVPDADPDRKSVV